MAFRIDDPPRRSRGARSPDQEPLPASPTQAESPLLDLEPGLVWHFFDGIRRIPRPSKKEDRIAAAVVEWAERQGFAAVTDEAGNVVVRVPAARELNDAPIVVLQAHLDMVGEKNADTEHDFDADPIRVHVDGDWVRARGTTLGADNGVGVAMAMAAAVDPHIKRGPLEMLFTLDEETGLNGAQALDGSLVQGRLMINLDAEEDDTVYIGCAGAAGVVARLPLTRKLARGGTFYRLALTGLRGGHSGVDIDAGRGNAVKLLARVLVAAQDAGLGQLDYRLVGFQGGDKPNAIAREAFAELYLDEDEIDAWRRHLDESAQQLRRQLGAADPGLKLELEPSPTHATPLDRASTVQYLRLLDALPHGPIAMSTELEGLVETSANLASTRTEETIASFFLSLRSSSDPALDGLGQSIASLFRLAGAAVDRLAGYSGWQPDPENAITRTTTAVYEQLFDASPTLAAVHAGVECGVVARRVPGLAAVSIGPTILGAHSPEERVSIESVGKSYRWLHHLLEELARPS